MNKKKVGILTFHNSRNYGAVLQAYALWRKLSELEDYVEVIDYHNCKIDKDLRLWNCRKKNIKGILRAVVAFIYYAKKKKAFDAFTKKHMILSKSVYRKDMEDYCKKFSILVAGSDQVWNMELTSDDTTYFLDFAEEGCLKTAYAASFGDIEVELPDKIKILLQKFDLITLREDNMKSAVEEAVQCNIEICCDPSFFLCADEWSSIASKRLEKKSYIFVFMIETSESLMEYARKLANDKKLILISNKNCFSFFKHMSPSDFLSWVLNAEYVLTNSFHGTVFSILFHKQFLSSVTNNEGKERTRITHLLKICGLEHRTLSNYENSLDVCEKWDEVKEKTDTFGKTSLDYIRMWVDKLYEKKESI